MIGKLFVVFVGVFVIVSTHLINAEELKIPSAVSPALPSKHASTLLDEPLEITSFVDKLAQFTCVGKPVGIYVLPYTGCVAFAVCYVDNGILIRRYFACPAGTIYNSAVIDCVPMQSFRDCPSP